MEDKECDIKAVFKGTIMFDTDFYNNRVFKDLCGSSIKHIQYKSLFDVSYQ